MDPSIPDGSVVLMKKYTIPPIPTPGTIVQYHDERGGTLKKLVRKKIRKPAKWNTPFIPSTLPSEASDRWMAAKSPSYTLKPWTGGRRLEYFYSTNFQYITIPRNDDDKKQNCYYPRFILPYRGICRLSLQDLNSKP